MKVFLESPVEVDDMLVRWAEVWLRPTVRVWCWGVSTRRKDGEWAESVRRVYEGQVKVYETLSRALTTQVMEQTAALLDEQREALDEDIEAVFTVLEAWA